MSKSHKVLKRVLIGLVIFLAVVTVAFFVWTANYYKAELVAIEVLENSDNIMVSDNITTIQAESPTTLGFIYYPGSNVEAIAYLPLLQQITAELGVTSFLVEMPFNQAFFDINAADEIIANNPNIDTWIMGGHSLGASMASDYASNNVDIIDALVVMGAYVYGDYPIENSLTIYGTFNSEIENFFDYTENVYIIDGGNHAQFGNYGKQAGDPDATISSGEQQNITVEAMKAFLTDLNILK